ncbi:hypothetical protein D1B31_05355 [Neobacillus notoginsengisoli]|uniref:YkoP-like domain-containing protein n=1 Tax=Neobacillus notoginsengisoli TaxID=1578198 RepID=A0A417YWU2_9BACI|nr:hypothetical protein [Neobacillus notoginsengisoli]RHW42067.1 hypothetical protein D1B31_05355 [Neobacillus notoginsengisoli]
MKQYIVSAWDLLDPFYYRCTRLTYLENHDNIFRVRLTRYKGRELILSDGVRISKNDLLVKIHLHNVRLLKEIYPLRSEIRKAKMIYQHVHQSLPGIEGYVRSHKRSAEIKGIIGITTLCTGSERLGFEVFDILHPAYKLLKWTAFLPITFLSANGSTLRKMSRMPPPGYLVMSKDKLHRLYKQSF